MLRDHFSNLCGRINQNVNKERLVLVLSYWGGGGLEGGRGEGGRGAEGSISWIRA